MLQNVKTKYGELQGVALTGYTVFKGVPYAKPPVEELRWKRPQEPDHWEGVRICDHFANITPQSFPTPDTPWGGLYYKEFYSDPEFLPPINEDCLYLNIWTPAEKGDEKLPVAFWIHGGGFGGGFNSEIEFDGEEYCKRGVILVTVEYRCGVFGFLAHPWLSAEDEKGISGNYGIYDQIAALDWVYENIAGFGGDPENITVFGQSAGCMSTQVLVSSPLTGNKISKAILQSGVETTYGFLATPSLEEEEEFGRQVVELTGAKSIEELRSMTMEPLMEAKDRFDGEMMRRIMSGEKSGAEGSLMIVPNVDGYLLEKSVKTVFAEGSMKKIPYIAGCVTDDLGRTDEDREKNEPGVLMESCKKWCGRQAELSNPPAYCYFFDHSLPGENGPDVAFHSAELWYTFGTLGRCWRPMEERDYEVSRQMLDAWTNFMKTGDPNGEGVPAWKPCTEEDPYVWEIV